MHSIMCNILYVCAPRVVISCARIDGRGDLPIHAAPHTAPTGRTKNETKRNLRPLAARRGVAKTRERQVTAKQAGSHRPATGRASAGARPATRSRFGLTALRSGMDTNLHIISTGTRQLRTYSTRRYALGYSEPAVNAYRKPRGLCLVCADHRSLWQHAPRMAPRDRFHAHVHVQTLRRPHGLRQPDERCGRAQAVPHARSGRARRECHVG